MEKPMIFFSMGTPDPGTQIPPEMPPPVMPPLPEVPPEVIDPPGEPVLPVREPGKVIPAQAGF
jgi:hypothetical protein